METNPISRGAIFPPTPQNHQKSIKCPGASSSRPYQTPTRRLRSPYQTFTTPSPDPCQTLTGRRSNRFSAFFEIFGVWGGKSDPLEIGLVSIRIGFPPRETTRRGWKPHGSYSKVQRTKPRVSPGPFPFFYQGAFLGPNQIKCLKASTS